jgi:hypothetical protein
MASSAPSYVLDFRHNSFNLDRRPVFASSGLRLAYRPLFPHPALAALAGVGQGQGVFVSKHSTAIQKRRNHPMNTIATATAQNPKQQQPRTAKEVIAANIQFLIQQLEAGHSESLTAYLDAMVHFHNYSFGNILAIARQKAVT